MNDAIHVVVVAVVICTFCRQVPSHGGAINAATLTLHSAADHRLGGGSIYPLRVSGFFEATDKLSLTIDGDDTNFLPTAVGGAIETMRFI